jgi:hypothetical protein
MPHRIARYAVITLLLVAGAQQLAACETDSMGFSQYYRLPANDPNYLLGTIGDFNDWGAISMDSNNVDCAKKAHDRLLSKLKTTPSGYFNQSLAGYYVALIFSAGVRLGSFGWFNTAPNPVYSTDTLAGQLDRVKNAYVEISHAGGCGSGLGGNSCMDDYAGEAAAWGWIAAFQLKRGDWNTGDNIDKARARLASFFNNICMHKGTLNLANVCNATYTDLANGQAEVFPYEHEFESVHYGFGLLTSVDHAIIGLEAAGSGYDLSDEEKTKARGLMKNIQLHVSNGSTWNSPNDCRKPTATGYDLVSCADFGYDPRMYRMGHFFLAPAPGQPPWVSGHVGNPPAGNYQSDGNCCASYPGWELSNFDSGFGYGRYATYYDQAYTWYTSRGNQYSDRYMPFDSNPAQGYLDAVNDDGWAFGWACDSDAPNSFVKVDLYANGTKIPDAADQYATWDSIQPEINSLCGGGTAHRWYSQVSSSYLGQTITAKARDYTFRPSESLPCVTECVR